MTAPQWRYSVAVTLGWVLAGRMDARNAAAEDNLRGALLMTLAMGCFSVEDALIKQLAESISAPQIIWMLGLGGALLFGADQVRRGEALWSADYRHPQVILRTGCEVFGTGFMISALAVVPLTLVSAIIQATPLVVAMGAAFLLGAEVGWRRWLAIGVGFLGVLLILRPGSQGFEPTVLLAVFGMLGLAARDLSTRPMPSSIPGWRLSTHAFAGLVPLGLILQLALGEAFVLPDLGVAVVLLACVVLAVGAYLAIVAATRLGDISVVSSFRYTRMLFALIVAGLAFGERPDRWTLIGVTIVIASGVYTLLREARLRRTAVPAVT